MSKKLNLLWVCISILEMSSCATHRISDRLLPPEMGSLPGGSPVPDLPGGKKSEEPKVINAESTIYDPKKQTELYQLRRLQMNQMDSIAEDLTQMEMNFKSLKDMVKTRIEQMHQIIDSNLDTGKVFKVTVDNLKASP